MVYRYTRCLIPVRGPRVLIHNFVMCDRILIDEHRNTNRTMRSLIVYLYVHCETVTVYNNRMHMPCWKVFFARFFQGFS